MLFRVLTAALFLFALPVLCHAADLAGTWTGAFEFDEKRVAQAIAAANDPNAKASIQQAMEINKQMVNAVMPKIEYSLQPNGKGRMIQTFPRPMGRPLVDARNGTWKLVPGEGKKATIEFTHPDLP